MISNSQSEFRAGDWVWSNTFRQLVRVVGFDQLWGLAECDVWVPSRNTVETSDLQSLLRTMDAHLLTKDRLVFAASIARVAEAVAETSMLSPLEGSLLLLPHQIIILQRALSNARIRYLLADEVGLGKTIEAGLILRELKLRGLVKRTLVLAPKGLTIQWVQEMRTHFGETFRLITSHELPILADILSADNPWTHFDQVVCSFDSVKPIENRRGWTIEQVEEYNSHRFDALADAGWDLVIIDEAHKMAGSTGSVARHRLARRLCDSVPLLLLLSATPHQGKSDSFQRLMSLVDNEEFPPNAPIDPERIAPYILRTEKRKAIDAKGRPLFTTRSTEMVKITWEPRHKLQEELYDKVTEYVKEGYNRAILENRQYLGFLMVLMQRLVSSSTLAIQTALEKRLEVLESREPNRVEPLESILEMDGQEQLDSLIREASVESKEETRTVIELRNLAIRCAGLNPDARAEALLDCINRQQVEENDIDLKFLVFTEFISTQEMLKDFLDQRGFSCVTLNGLMDLEERRRAQETFLKEAKVMISTDAGGEGLNLQFCHIVTNFDLPWNPMRIEQRIGRVDRIGQEHPVKVFNLVIENSVEYRVRAVLEEKLRVILSEFGVDKTSDVLESAESGADFEKAFITSIVNPDSIQANLSELAATIRKELQNYQDGKKLLPDIGEIDPDVAQRLSSVPIAYWLERAVTSYVAMMGGSVKKTLDGYNLTLNDGSKLDNVTFKGSAERGRRLALDDAFVKSIIPYQRQWADKQPVAMISLPGFTEEVFGYFSLWKVTLEGYRQLAYTFPLYVTLGGKTLKTTASYVWDMLVDGNFEIKRIMPEGTGGDHADTSNRLVIEKAKAAGEEYFKALEKDETMFVEREKERKLHAFKIQRESISRIGLDNVREKRLRELEVQEATWNAQLRTVQVIPRLEPLLLVEVGA